MEVICRIIETEGFATSDVMFTEDSKLHLELGDALRKASTLAILRHRE